MPVEPPEGRKVKRGPVGAIEATDRHERAKDYLSPAEMAGRARDELTRTIDGVRTMAAGPVIDVVQPHRRLLVLGVTGNATRAVAVTKSL